MRVHKRRRAFYWLAVVLSVVAVAVGSLLTWQGYRSTLTADSVVREYFAALQHGDAAAALGYGNVPSGSHAMLTPAVLRASQSVAPIRNVHITKTRTSGGRGDVEVEYEVAFPNTPALVTDTVPVVRSGSEWRLASPVIDTSIVMPTAQNRASVLGKAVPDGAVLVFPGALPITFDSDYLQLDPTQDYATFATGQVLPVSVTVSRAGHDAVLDALRSKLRDCLESTTLPDPRCPLPDERYVPGSVRGQVPDDLETNLQIELRSGPSGLLAISAAVLVDATYKRLTYANVAIAGSGRVDLDVHASAYAVSPLRLTWVKS